MKYKFYIGLSILVLTSVNIFSQSKLRGNKIVTTQNREVSNFNNIEVSDDVDVYLSQGNNNTVAVETDENLQSAIRVQVDNNTLRINFSDKISKSKKRNVYVTVNEDLHTISAYKNANIYADTRLILRKLTINAFENADFKVKIDADDFKINGFKNTDLTIDVFSKNIVAKISDACELKLEGEIDSLKTEIKNNSVLIAKGKGSLIEIEARNNGTFNGENFKIENAFIDANSRTDITVNVKESVKLSLSNKAEVNIYNNPVVEIEKLEGKAQIHKKKISKLF
ncbi:MAG: DUF2807 domain-containing protein [Flavobacteriaceae bacterium]|nr:DUF2807 domain-containing protein [Flavobacteriaceae bacterium]